MRLHGNTGSFPSGEIPILQSDTVLLNQPRTTLLAVEGERFHVVDLQHIAQLTFGGQPTAEQLAT